MTINEILSELRNPISKSRVLELEAELSRIELESKIQAARDWAKTDMISREQLRSVIVDLMIDGARSASCCFNF